MAVLDWLQQLLGGAPQVAPRAAMPRLLAVGASTDYGDVSGDAPSTRDNRDQHWLAPGQPRGLSSPAGPFAGRGTFLHPNEAGIFGWQGRTISPGDEVIRPGDGRAFTAPYMPNASGDEYQRRLNQQIIPSWRSFPEANGGVRISYPGAVPPAAPPRQQPQIDDSLIQLLRKYGLLSPLAAGGGLLDTGQEPPT